jgi:hypothetical protein
MARETYRTYSAVHPVILSSNYYTAPYGASTSYFEFNSREIFNRQVLALKPAPRLKPFNPTRLYYLKKNGCLNVLRQPF